jgi:hypothetical protein
MTPRFTLRKVLLGSLTAAALWTASTAPVQAQDQLIVVEPEHPTLYVNGGIGQEDETYMKKMAKDWPLRLVFSERKDNDYIANVNLLITDLHGTPFLQLTGAGPLTYAMLPAGKYRLIARFQGVSETREVTLDGKTGRDVVFHWKAASQ